LISGNEDNEKQFSLVEGFRREDTGEKIKKGKLLTSHRSTTYPCCLPALGDSAGAGRIRLAGCKDRES